jgi:hypothetical protein
VGARRQDQADILCATHAARRDAVLQADVKNESLRKASI